MSIIKIGIECESIENKNSQWGIGKMVIKLLEELSQKPELKNNYRFILYFKDNVPDFNFLKSSIFEIKRVPVPFFKNRLFPIYYLILLPMRLWLDRPSIMFWPAYMLPFFTFTESLCLMTEDVYYEAFKGKLSFQYRFFYAVFGTYAAKRATKLMAISETSKKNLLQLYKIKPERVFVNYLGIDSQPKDQGLKTKALDFQPLAFSYILFVGQMFPRRHAKETILAFEKLKTTYSHILKNLRIGDLRLILVGPDKYPEPTIEPLVKKINESLGTGTVIHKNYLSNEELTEFYANAKALVYVSEREAFGLPPMEALSFGIPPVVMNNELGHELFGEYAFYSKSGEVDDITETIKQALSEAGPSTTLRASKLEFVKKYSWKSFANRFLEISTRN